MMWRVPTTQRILPSAALILTLVLGAWIAANTLAQERGDVAPTQSSRAAAREVTGEGGIQQQLDQILENQQKMIERLDEALSEVSIIKIRASR